MGENEQKIILIDADVVSHFIYAGEAWSIKELFPNNPIHVLDKVHAELQNWPNAKIRTEISNLLSKKIIRLRNFPEENEDIKKEYLWIKSMLFKGDGESACLAVARYDKKILASSNLRDTLPYCKMHNINYLTTMDFLCNALENKKFSKQRCNDFITAVLKSNGKLPVKSMDDYTCRDISFIL
jgi:hypothetical protein